MFCSKLGKVHKKKKISLKFSPIFCPKLGEEHKKKMTKRFSQKFSPIVSPKLGEEQKKKKDLYRNLVRVFAQN